MASLREQALVPLLQPHAVEKAQLTLAIDLSVPVGADLVVPRPEGIPGRPALPALVPFNRIKQFPLDTPKGRAALLHSITHIELNAIDLALDIVWRFANMPEAFYIEWMTIAKEEAKHFLLLRNHLVTLGFDYGDFDAHNALWDMAERTSGDLLARIALVPRTLEARGLDASPAVRTKLISVGDHRAGEILEVILRDEIGHVACGNRWYRYLCRQRGLDPVAHYAELTVEYDAPTLRPPFNIEARRQAGFEQSELDALIR